MGLGQRCCRDRMVTNTKDKLRKFNQQEYDFKQSVKGIKVTSIDTAVEEIFQHYRQHGYPFYPTTMEFRKKELIKLLRFNKPIIKDKIVTQTMHGLALAWSYFPEHIKVKCGKMLTPYEVFSDDELFKKAIRKRIKIGSYVSDSGIRKILKIYSGTQSVSNFRPTSANAIYSKFLLGGGWTWDMSAGYGGRLLGAIKSGINYIGTDPCKTTYDGLKEMSSDCNRFLPNHHTCVEIIRTGSEDFVPVRNSLDLCFTSPPYFDLEKYSDDEGQSYIRYPKFEDWLEYYWRRTIKNCRIGLKKNGWLVVNISLDLKRRMSGVITQEGFDLVDRYEYALSNLNGQSYKYEPILVFKKKG